MSSPPSSLWCRTLQNNEGFRADSREEFDALPRWPLVNCRAFFSPPLPLALSRQNPRAKRGNTLRCRSRTWADDRRQERADRVVALVPSPSRGTGKTIKGRRGAVSPCMIMRCNLRHKRNDMVKEEKDYTARWGRWAGGMHETGVVQVRDEGGG